MLSLATLFQQTFTFVTTNLRVHSYLFTSQLFSFSSFSSVKNELLPSHPLELSEKNVSAAISQSDQPSIEMSTRDIFITLISVFLCF